MSSVWDDTLAGLADNDANDELKVTKGEFQDTSLFRQSYHQLSDSRDRANPPN